jgi:hypothetical protein
MPRQGLSSWRHGTAAGAPHECRAPARRAGGAGPGNNSILDILTPQTQNQKRREGGREVGREGGRGEGERESPPAPSALVDVRKATPMLDVGKGEEEQEAAERDARASKRRRH